MDQYLPVPVDRPEDTRRQMALNAGAGAGWWTWTVGNVSRRAAECTYVVTLASGVRRELLAEEVLPWALGIADGHGRPEVIAYRPGLAPEQP